jgi:MFS family permease
VARSPRVVERIWAPADEQLARSPRRGLLVEHPGRPADDSPDTHEFEQAEGPFRDYRRVVTCGPDRIVDRTEYRLVVPWFGWLFRPAVRRALRRHSAGTGSPPAWAPPDRLTAHHVLLLGLLGAASMSAAFVNTLFTQTVNFAAAEFGISEGGQGLAGVIVRAGILIALPFTFLADRVGRRRIMVLLAWLAPICAALGALAPNFWVLTASQAVGRPLAIALDLLIAIVAAEEMPRNSRAYAVSVLAMASGLGAGVAVASLPLADLGTQGWRLVYVVGLVWLLVALDLTRRLTETQRFTRAVETARLHVRRLDRRRLVTIGTVAFSANLFVAPASYFQNRYLDDIRDYSGSGIAMFTLVTATPASLGFVVGGRIADTTGRRRVLAAAMPAATALLALSFWVGGWPMWLAAFAGGLLAGIAYPAFAVYRTELFPTGRRGQAGGLLAAMALLGGSIGLLVAGALLDAGWSYGAVMSLMALGQLVAATVVLTTYPETAHRVLEELNPEDQPPGALAEPS